MMTKQPSVGWLFVVLACLLAVGCESEKKATEPAQEAKADSDSSTKAPDTTATGDASSTAASSTPAAVPAEPAEPFDPPTLKELDKMVEWEDRPVRDALKLLAKDLAQNPPLATVEEALAMRNINAEENAKILSALGRLPKNPDDVAWNSSIARHLLGELNNINPIMMNSVHEFDIAELIMFGLFGFDWELQNFATSETVETWQSSKDHLYDKVVMRDDLTWSDGQPITAHDVAFSWAAIMNEKIPVPAVRSGTDELKGVVAYDDRTVVFFHKRALATNDQNINFPVIPRHVYEPLYKKLDQVSWGELQQDPDYQKYEREPVCGGPYAIESYDRSQQMVLKRRESWFMHDGKQVREKPYFDEVRFRIMEDPNTALLAVKSGQIDIMEISPEQWVSQATSDDFFRLNTKARGVQWLYFYFGWNNRDPLFSDRRVRQALSYTFDYKDMLENILYGLCEPCAGIFYPTSWMSPKPPLKPYQQDLDKAEALLDEAGWTDSDEDGIRDKVIDGKLTPFRFNMLVRAGDPDRKRICERMKFNLSQIGIECNVQQLETTVLVQRMHSKNYQAYYGGWGTGTDPDTSDNIWMTEAIADGRNYLQYSNPEVDKLYEEGKLEFDREKRAGIYAKIDETLYRDQPCTFLFFRSSFYSFNKQLRGYRFSPRGPFHYSPGPFSIWRVAQ